MIHFKYTNHQRGIRAGQSFFQLLFLGAAIYILFNFGEFFEHSPVATIFIIIMLISFLIPFFIKKGSQNRQDISVSNNSIIIGGLLRFSFEDLFLDIYSREGGSKNYQLYSKGKDFLLHTVIEDDLMLHLKTVLPNTQNYSVSDYNYSREGKIFIGTDEGKIVKIDLETGVFSWVFKDSEKEESFVPKDFIANPKYVRSTK